ncbi:MAG TPA: hypothetical protein VGL40_02050 [Bacillota bacterium]
MRKALPRLSLNRILLAVLILLGLATAASGTGLVGRNYSCVDCHTDRERLINDLAMRPVPAPPKSEEQSGEG